MGESADTSGNIIVRSDDKFCVAGYSGAGKTLLMKYFLDNVVSNFPNLIVIDPVSKFSEKVNIRYKGVVKALKPRPNQVVYKIQTEEDMEKILTKVNDLDNESAFVICDEIDQFIPFNHMFTETSLFFQQGRNYNHGGMFTVRQMGRLNKQIFSNSHYLILFRVYNRNDIDYLTTVIPYKFVKLIPELSEHSFYLIDLHTSRIIGEYELDLTKDKLKRVEGNIEP